METAVRTRPALGEILTTMLVLGIQSFGGGSSTFYLIHQACLRRGWLDEHEFLRTWALAQIAPGINLLGLTVLIGRHLDGARGVALSLAGLLLPSFAITVIMTAMYASIRDLPIVRACQVARLSRAAYYKPASIAWRAMPR